MDGASASAPPLRPAEDATVASLRASLVDDQAPLAARYRALFSLRNLAGEKTEQALIEGERKGGQIDIESELLGPTARAIVENRCSRSF